MPFIVALVGIAGFVGSLLIMYCTKLGIPGIREYDPGFRLLDMRFNYSKEDVYSTFEKIGEGGISAYRHYLVVDFTFIAFFLFVMILGSMKVTSNAMFRNILIALASVRALLDVVENSLLIYLLGKFPIQDGGIAALCSRVTTLKFIAMYSWMAIAAVLVVAHLRGAL